MQTLTLIRGIPGSGKTTLAKTICFSMNNGSWHNGRFKNCFYYEADLYMIDNKGNYCFDKEKLKYCHDTCFENAIATLKDGYSVVVSNTFIKRWEMQRYIDAAKEIGVEVIEITVKSDFESTHGVPTETIERMKRDFEN